MKANLYYLKLMKVIINKLNNIEWVSIMLTFFWAKKCVIIWNATENWQKTTENW